MDRMDLSFNFYLDPRQIAPSELTTGVTSISLTRAGQTTLLEPPPSGLQIHQEHPPVERMEGDLGAICEVFKQSSTYFLALPGAALAPGDRLTLAYRHKPYTVTLTVIALEAGRAQIEPPIIDAGPAPGSSR